MTTTGETLDDGFIPLKITPDCGIYLALCIIDREHGRSDDDVRAATQHLLLEIDRLRALLGQNGIDDGYQAGVLTPTFGRLPVAPGRRFLRVGELDPPDSIAAAAFR